ncbi:hypothetical protein FALBO_11965 [Fusarium albosuccineum]|uniref:Uncharacterized protein n=1 Tax=Fusarium albosuccineum TaxID=1237068 RepID=A0A8H4P8G1_9HYPO|nr:hypothetical protein FALBO_11965 [Fusarium albosuccineum]
MSARGIRAKSHSLSFRPGTAGGRGVPPITVPTQTHTIQMLCSVELTDSHHEHGKVNWIGRWAEQLVKIRDLARLDPWSDERPRGLKHEMGDKGWPDQGGSGRVSSTARSRGRRELAATSDHSDAARQKPDGTGQDSTCNTRQAADRRQTAAGHSHPSIHPSIAAPHRLFLLVSLQLTNSPLLIVISNSNSSCNNSNSIIVHHQRTLLLTHHNSRANWHQAILQPDLNQPLSRLLLPSFRHLSRTLISQGPLLRPLTAALHGTLAGYAPPPQRHQAPAIVYLPRLPRIRLPAYLHPYLSQTPTSTIVAFVDRRDRFQSDTLPLHRLAPFALVTHRDTALLPTVAHPDSTLTQSAPSRPRCQSVASPLPSPSATTTRLLYRNIGAR